MLILIIIIIILFIINIYVVCKKHDGEYFSKYDGICAFDIDGTANEGQKNICKYKGKIYNCTQAAIKACKDKNYKLAVNTASNRDRNTYCCRTGFCDEDGKCLINEKNWWNNQKFYSSFKNDINHGGCGKTKVIKKLMENYGIKNKQHVVLWDDYYKNIASAQSAGFGVIGSPNLYDCSRELAFIGIQQEQLDDFVNNNVNKKFNCKWDFKKCI